MSTAVGRGPGCCGQRCEINTSAASPVLPSCFPVPCGSSAPWRKVAVTIAWDASLGYLLMLASVSVGLTRESSSTWKGFPGSLRVPGRCPAEGTLGACGMTASRSGVRCSAERYTCDFFLLSFLLSYSCSLLCFLFSSPCPSPPSLSFLLLHPMVLMLGKFSNTEPRPRPWSRV